MKKTHWIILVAVLLLLLGGGGAWYLLRPEPAPVAAAATSANAETIGTEERHTMGDPKAPVTLIEYAAFTCPHCAEFNELVIPALKEKYINTGKVFYVFRVLPIDPADFKAEGLTSCLAKEKYFEVGDALFKRQNEWGPMQMSEHGPGYDMEHQPKTDAGLIKVAGDLGLDAAKARSCMLNTEVHLLVNTIAEAGAQRYGLTGTPTVIVNGQVVTTPHDAAQLSALLDPMLQGK